MTWTRGLRLTLLAAASLCVTAGAAPAVTPLLSLYFVPDITVVLNGVTVSPQEVAIDDLMGDITRLSIGDVPAGARLTSFVELGGGNRLLSFDTTVDLGNGVIAHPADVVYVHPSTVTILFDAAAHGVPEGATVGALTMARGDSLVMSFDVTVKLGDVTASPADLVILVNDAFELFFDGAAAGVPPGLHIDAAQVLQPSGHLLLSFDGSGVIGNPAIAFDDEDVLEYDPDTDTWQLAYDGSADAPGWAPADLAAVFAFQQPDTPTPTSAPSTTPVTTPTRTATATATAVPTNTELGGSPTATLTGSPAASSTPTQAAPCAGDCNGSGEVSISELITMVNIALGTSPVTLCEAGDLNHNGIITVNEIITAVGNALGSCPG